MRPTVVIAFALLGGACASKPAQVTYVQARAIPQAPRMPAVVSIPKPMPMPGQLMRTPGPEKDIPPESRGAWQVIDDANTKATQVPSQEGYFNAIMQYDFAPGALFQVYTAPLRITDIAIQPNEQLTGPPAIGDTVRWVIAPGRSISAGLTQRHIYVKPTRPGLHTTLTITTDKRTYLIELHSFKDTYMAAVTWRYPQDELGAFEEASALAERQDKIITSPNVQLDAVRFDYRVEVKSGRPAWTPSQVFDDGRKTFIRFPPEMLTREAPALFVLSASEIQLVNYRVKNEFYIVDRLFDQAELRVGTDGQEIVRIQRISSAPRAQAFVKGR
jgi:type IV secretion system protein VirB9